MSKTVNNCVIPTDRHLDVDEHVWAKVDDGTVTIGMTDVAQSLAKRFLHAHLKGEGTAVDKGDSVATVESSKYVGPVKTPVGGEVVAANEAVDADAEMINMDPYDEGWIVKVEPDNLEADLESTLEGEAAVDAYRAVIEDHDQLEECEHLEGSTLAE
jgi:glycine cleavage system H protein